MGFVLWLLVTLAFRFFGDQFFYPGEGRLYAMLIASPIVMGGITFLALRVLGAANIDRAEGAMSLALPGMALDVYAVNAFPTAFPNLDPTLDGAFAAIKLLGYTGMLFVGLFSTRIAPSDEKL
jgi:hypothetical protein